MSSDKKIEVIGAVPSFNNQNTISHVVEQLGKSFSKRKESSLLIDCDGGSTDDTLKKFLNTKTKMPKRVIVAAPGTTGKGLVFKLLFKFVKVAGAKTVLVNDSDLRSINPKWVNLQIDAIKEYDYATPLYSRYKYDGQITKHICYPIIYGVFGRNIRQPIGGDFSFSGDLAKHWLYSKWPVNAKLFGIDIFMTTNAILGGFKICQVNLGAKIHDARDPSASLSPMFRQVVSTLFKIIIRNPSEIKKLRFQDVPVLGSKKLKKPQEFGVDSEAARLRFIKGFHKHKEIIRKALSKEDFVKMQAMVQYGKVHIQSDWWVKIVYDYIIAFKKHERISSSILQSMVPLWFGRIHTFINETQKMNTAQAEKLILKQAKEFHKRRTYLLNRL